MALTPAQQSAVATIITQEGGLANFFTTVQQLYLAQAQANALATLTPAITVTVSNWAALGTYIASPLSVSVAQVMAAITAAAQAQNAAQLGPLMVALYAAVKNQP